MPSTLDVDSTNSTNRYTIHSITDTSSSQASVSDRLSEGSSSTVPLSQQTLSQDIRMPGDIDDIEDDIEDFDDDIIW